MSDRDKLMSAARQADVLDAAGRLIANPVRAVVSRAEMLAIADVMERSWAICLEAELLVAALAMPETGIRDHAIHTQADCVRTLMAALCGEPPKENTDGSSHS